MTVVSEQFYNIWTFQSTPSVTAVALKSKMKFPCTNRNWISRLLLYACPHHVFSLYLTLRKVEWMNLRRLGPVGWVKESLWRNQPRRTPRTCQLCQTCGKEQVIIVSNEKCSCHYTGMEEQQINNPTLADISSIVKSIYQSLSANDRRISVTPLIRLASLIPL